MRCRQSCTQIGDDGQRTCSITVVSGDAFEFGPHAPTSRFAHEQAAGRGDQGAVPTFDCRQADPSELHPWWRAGSALVGDDLPEMMTP